MTTLARISVAPGNIPWTCASRTLLRNTSQKIGTVAVSLKQLFDKGFPSILGVPRVGGGIKARRHGARAVLSECGLGARGWRRSSGCSH